MRNKPAPQRSSLTQTEPRMNPWTSTYIHKRAVCFCWLISQVFFYPCECQCLQMIQSRRQQSNFDSSPLCTLKGKLAVKGAASPRCAWWYPHQRTHTSGPDHYGNAPEQPEVTRQRDLVWLNVDFKPCDNAAISFHALGEQTIKHWSLLSSDANTSVCVCVCVLFFS